MSGHEMTGENKRLTTDAAAAATDASSNKSNNTDYGTSGEQEDDNKKEEAIAFPSCRHVLYLMMFLGFVVAFSLRGCFNEVIVAMVNQTAVNERALAANISEYFECPRDARLEVRDGEFNWDRHQQATLLAAFYYGYILTQVYSFGVTAYTYNKGKGKVFEYSLPSVGPRADPGVQAVSPHVT